MTTNQTERVSDEELDQMIWKLERDGMTPKMLSLMKELREVRRAKGEPVAWLLSGGGAKNDVRFDSSNAYADPLREVTPLYAAPQLPQPAVLSVPAAMEMDDDFDSAFEHGKAVGWNAYRAAMLQAEPVSNSDELPLDYLQGHKDGLEWAAQLAEANHPQTGDWLYDDPIELARAIRKGPDMPTVQDGNSPVTPDGWIPVSERMPDPKSELRVCVYTPNPHEDIRYRFVPASLFKAVCRDATHWHYMSAPKEVG